ncbi:aminoacyl-tRNA hydrolase [Arenibacter sp. F26102]|uniref:aminoacyl-tRNA hydrolase n=1 Tax=Arenibacter sp. F26102 TaxID=2926416 RepID=UPI001FF21D84|nr:aminoacyl-tRNA hydrolase [Arenibacter sp. F26102]MCK0144485.1 aminoacyl-tRNA hydrolase [Arenibacter sp. F26102]
MFHIFESLFKRSRSLLDESDSMKKFMVVGLGNIGEEYSETRHNIGFKILDSLSRKEGFSFETAKLGDVGTFKVKGRSILCLKPSTYMNRSGKAVKYWMEKENIPHENLLVITDDINLSFGTIRLKTKGSDGGHNGLKDIQEHLLTTNYNRLRFGVGSDFGKGKQIDYVLGEWNEEEKEALVNRYERINELVRSFVLSGVNRTMNEFNGT